MASPGGIPLWYPCVEEKFRAAFDERLTAWVFGGQATIFKSAYDAAWVTAGGTVGTGDYATALEMLDSSVDAIPDGSGGTIGVIHTPIARLTAYAMPWQAFLNDPTPCRLVRTF